MLDLLTVTTLPTVGQHPPVAWHSTLSDVTREMPHIGFIAMPAPATAPTLPAGTRRAASDPVPFLSAPIFETNAARCTCGDAVLDHDRQGCHVAGCRCRRNPIGGPVAGRRSEAPALPALPPLVTPGAWAAVGVFAATAITLVVFALLPVVAHG